MKIAIATALYPPDATPVARYVKECASRLSETHETTVVLYGYLPEHVPNVRPVSVDKRAMLPVRVWRFFFTLLRETRQHEVLIIENGPSVELPALLVLLLTHTPAILIISDSVGIERTKKNIFYDYIHAFLKKRVGSIISDLPNDRPEILPFFPIEKEKLDAYQRSWEKHLTLLDTALTPYAGK